MNYVFISPDFPTNFKTFATRLKDQGINVLGIGSENYDNLETDLRESLTEYYRVDNMHDYDQMLKACAFLTFKHGKLDFIESHNEHWLEQDARLRTDFNVVGLKTMDMGKIKLKSEMKEVFKKIGVPYARGNFVKNKEDALELISIVGFPVCVKPNQPIEASTTYKINNLQELDMFFKTKNEFDYMMEEFIQGKIQTFDGIVDKNGELVTMSSMHYSDGIMESIIEKLDSVFFVQRNIPDDLILIGEKIIKEFSLKAQFFHIEFFRLENNDLVVLELNARPPGGLCLETINYSMDDDIYRQYACIIADKNVVSMLNSKPYYCAFVGLKVHESPPIHYIDENREKYGDMIVFAAPNPPFFTTVMGDYVVILRHENLEVLEEAVNFIRER